MLRRLRENFARMFFGSPVGEGLDHLGMLLHYGYATAARH
jgi:hypothetical protein